MQAMQGLVLQVNGALESPGTPPPPPSSGQLAALKTVFGNERPLRSERLPAPKGQQRQRLTLPAHQYSADGAKAEWDAASWQISSSGKGNRIQASGSWPSLAVQMPQTSFRMQGMRMQSQAQRTSPKALWQNNVRATVARIEISTPQAPPIVFSGNRLNSSSKLRGTVIDQRVELAADTLAVAGVQIDALHFAYQLRNLDQAAMKQLQTPAAPEDSQRVLLARFRELMLKGAALQIDDISARYKGHTVRLRGNISMPGVTEQDFSSRQQLLRKLALRLDISVPLPLLREVADTTARRLKQSNPAVSAQDIYSAMLGKALANNYARVDKNTLHSSIEFREGVLRVNGQVLELPAALKGMLSDPPEPDRSVPQIVQMEDRKLEHLLAFAMNGDSDGINALCIHYFDSKAEASAAEALKWCRTAADAKDAYAAHLLGLIYQQGRGTPADPAGAVEWFRRAISYGARGAHFELYLAYRDGKGVTADAATAQAHLIAAAEAGHTDAIALLAQAGDPWHSRLDAPSFGIEQKRGDIRYRTSAGRYIVRNYRFDEKMSRTLVFTLSSPQQHEKWGPLGNICLTAEGPSEEFCVRFAAVAPEHTTLRLVKRFTTPKGEDIVNETLEAELAVGGPHKIEVYVANNVAHFVINDEIEVAQRISYPAELLELSCSTATCHFDFDVAPAAAGQ